MAWIPNEDNGMQFLFGFQHGIHVEFKRQEHVLMVYSHVFFTWMLSREIQQQTGSHASKWGFCNPPITCNGIPMGLIHGRIVAHPRQKSEAQPQKYTSYFKQACEHNLNCVQGFKQESSRSLTAIGYLENGEKLKYKVF